MATIYKEIFIDATPERAWEALRDFGALHTKLVAGFVTACELQGDSRIVTFFNGATAREQLVGIDGQIKRLCYTVVGGKATHHNASAQIFAEDGNRTRFVWITDVLPNELVGYIGPMMDQGAAAIKRTLESS